MEKQSAKHILRLFNQKVSKLVSSKFFIRYKEDQPQVVAKFDKLISVKPAEDGSIEILGRVNSWVPEFEQEEVDAFVLTYRMLIQNNDRISIAKLGEIYESEWMPIEAAKCFQDAREQLNVYLDETGTTFSVGPWNLSIRKLLDTIIYGGLAHVNREKQLLFDALTISKEISGFVWVEFLAALREMMRYLLYFSSLNEAVLRDCFEQ